MYYIGLDVHKKTISYCVKDVSGRIQQEGKVGSTQRELDCWMKTLPQPWTVAMEATIISGWIYDHLLPHAAQIKVAHPLMLRAIAAAKKKNDQIDASKIADCLRCDFLPGVPHDARRDTGSDIGISELTVSPSAVVAKSPSHLLRLAEFNGRGRISTGAVSLRWWPRASRNDDFTASK